MEPTHEGGGRGRPVPGRDAVARAWGRGMLRGRRPRGRPEDTRAGPATSARPGAVHVSTDRGVPPSGREMTARRGCAHGRAALAGLGSRAKAGADPSGPGVLPSNDPSMTAPRDVRPFVVATAAPAVPGKVDSARGERGVRARPFSQVAKKDGRGRALVPPSANPTTTGAAARGPSVVPSRIEAASVRRSAVPSRIEAASVRRSAVPSRIGAVSVRRSASARRVRIQRRNGTFPRLRLRRAIHNPPRRSVPTTPATSRAGRLEVAALRLGPRGVNAGGSVRSSPFAADATWARAADGIPVPRKVRGRRIGRSSSGRRCNGRRASWPVRGRRARRTASCARR